MLVEQRPDAPVGVAGHDRVALAQRSALDEHRGDGATALVQLALDDDTLRVLLGVRAQVQRGVGGQQDRREQLVEALAGRRGDVDEHRVAAVLLGHQPVLGELLTDLGGVGPLLVDLVDRDHDRHVGGLGVVERLDRLRHDAVVGRDHQHDDVGDLRATGTHRGERLVTRGVDEGDRTLVVLQLGDDLVGADVLGDATGLLRHHVGVPDRVEELGLSVVDVTHDGHDRRTGRPVLLVALLVTEGEVEGLEELAVLVLGADDLDDPADLGTEQLQRLVVDRLRRGDHLAQVEQGGDQRGRLGVDLLGEVGQRGAAGQPDGLPVAARQADAAHRRAPPWSRTPDAAASCSCGRGPDRDHRDGRTHRQCRHPSHHGRDHGRRRHHGSHHRRAHPHRELRRRHRDGSHRHRHRRHRDHRDGHRGHHDHRDRRGRHRDDRRRPDGRASCPGRPLRHHAGVGTRSAGTGRRTRTTGAGRRARTAGAGTGTAGTGSGTRPTRRGTCTGRGRARTGTGSGTGARAGSGRGRGGAAGRGELNGLLPGRGAGRGPGRGPAPAGADPPAAAGRGAAGRAAAGCWVGRTRRRSLRSGCGRARAGGRRGRTGRRSDRRHRGRSDRAARRARRLPEQAAAAAGWGGGGARTGSGLGGRRSVTAAGLAAESLPEPPGHGGLDGGGRGLHELALLLELGEHGLAVDTELFGEFVYAGFAWHGSPHW